MIASLTRMALSLVASKDNAAAGEELPFHPPGLVWPLSADAAKAVALGLPPRGQPMNRRVVPLKWGHPGRHHETR